jgi:arginase
LVPFDGMGRSSGQAGAPAALRPAGFEAAFPSSDVVSSPELRVPAPRAERGHSGLLNEVALLTMIQQLSVGLRASIAAGRFPLVYGADCSVLMAALPALRDSIGEPGLLFIDGHEDATPMQRSPDGEAANMEIAILLGDDGRRLAAPVADLCWRAEGRRARYARSTRRGVASSDGGPDHTDLDVLDRRDFSARDASGEVALSGGLT